MFIFSNLVNPVSTALACATCQPDQNTDVARASNMAILFMVAIVFAMFGVVLKIILNFARKQRAHQDSAS